MAKDYNSYTFKNKAVDNIQSRTNTANDPDDKKKKKEKRGKKIAKRVTKRAGKKYKRFETLSDKSIAQGKKSNKKYDKNYNYTKSYKKVLKTKAKSLKNLDKSGRLKNKAFLYDMGASRKQVRKSDIND